MKPTHQKVKPKIKPEIGIESVIIPSPIGNLELITDDNHLKGINFLYDTKKVNHKKLTPIHKMIMAQLYHYFSHANHQFTLPLFVKGTEYQQRVWKAIQDIPVGETRSYLELAKKLRTHPRAIGQACRTNPLPLIIPCHRIVSSSGIGGFSGETAGKWIAVKQWLLRHEKVKTSPADRHR